MNIHQPTEGLIPLLKLHGVIIIWGFTSIIGVLMDELPALETTLYRTAIAAAVLATRRQ